MGTFKLQTSKIRVFNYFCFHSHGKQVSHLWNIFCCCK